MQNAGVWLPLSRIRAYMSFTAAAFASCRLESVLYSLTAVTKELLALRQPALAQLQAAASWASTACTKVCSRPEERSGGPFLLRTA